MMEGHIPTSDYEIEKRIEELEAAMPTLIAKVKQLEENVDFWKKACLANQHNIYKLENQKNS